MENKDILSHVDMILGLDQNRGGSSARIPYLFYMMRKILAYDTSPVFLDSLKTSQDITVDTGSYLKNCLHILDQLKANDLHSFAIFPIRSYGIHMFSGCVRKMDHSYSVTLVNKENEPLYYDQYEEFIYNDRKKLAHNLKLTGLFFVNSYRTKDVYALFKESANAHYKLNITSARQKTGNCFVKEPEASIKYAYSTRNFSVEDLKNLRTTHKNFRPKWGIPTIELHKRYVLEVANQNPHLKNELMLRLDKYIERKTSGIIPHRKFSTKTIENFSFHKNSTLHSQPIRVI
jgi:hypothetical protein